MKAKAEKIVNSLQAFVKELESKRTEGPVHKTKQLDVIQNAMKNLQQSSITIPDEMISLENRLKLELKEESHVISEVYAYLKAEIAEIFEMDFSEAATEPVKMQEEVQDAPEEKVEEKMQKKIEEPVTKEVETPVPEKSEPKVEEQQVKPKIKKVIMNDDSQVSMRPSFRFRQR